MSTGIGKTQQRILDTLAASERGHLTVIELATALGLRDNQVRRAVHSLAGRGLVALTKEAGGWAGIGQYGPLVRRDTVWYEDGERHDGYGPEVPTAETRRFEYYDDYQVAYGKTEYVHAGMPVGISLFVWTPEAAAEKQAHLDRFRAAFTGE